MVGVTVFEEEVEIEEGLGVEVGIGVVEEVEEVLIGAAVGVALIGEVAADLEVEVAIGVEGVVLKAEGRGAEMMKVAKTDIVPENHGEVMAKGGEGVEVAVETLGANLISIIKNRSGLMHHRKTKKSPLTNNC